MASWVQCSDTGEAGRDVFVNLDAAYLIRPTRSGSAIHFLVADQISGEPPRPVVHHVRDSPTDIMSKLRF